MRKASEGRLVAGARIMGGVISLSTGIMKYAVPMLWEAWSGQLTAAAITFYSLTLWTAPAGEIVLGIALMLGLFARLAALAVSGLMVAATYVHLTVSDPSLFPLQPHLPVAPLMVLAMALLVVVKGAGAFSLDRVGGSWRHRSPVTRIQETAW